MLCVPYCGGECTAGNPERAPGNFGIRTGVSVAVCVALWGMGVSRLMDYARRLAEGPPTYVKYIA